MLTKIKLNAKNLVQSYKKSLLESKSQKKLTMCKKCYTFYYKNSWHFEIPTYLKERREEEVPVLFSQCPPCVEEENTFYDSEAELIFN